MVLCVLCVRVCVVSVCVCVLCTGNSEDGSDLTNPWGVAFDLSGNLHVADNGSSCIKVLTSDGKYVTQYGSGEVSYAAGIAIDEEGYSFVSEYRTSNDYGSVIIFDPKHTFLTSYEDSSHVGITFDKEGFLYVADPYNCQVEKF